MKKTFFRILVSTLCGLVASSPLSMLGVYSIYHALLYSATHSEGVSLVFCICGIFAFFSFIYAVKFYRYCRNFVMKLLQS